jgi:(2Fe-2S) ferredoxin
MKAHQRHVLMCTGPRCTDNGIEAEALFKKLGQLIDRHGGLPVKRTRTHCFAICKEGPILVVYPDGIWYHRLDETTLEHIVNDHLAAGRPVESHIFHRTGLGDVIGATSK